MTKAEDWFNQISNGLPQRDFNIDDIKNIQKDALESAAEVCQSGANLFKELGVKFDRDMSESSNTCLECKRNINDMIKRL